MKTSLAAAFAAAFAGAALVAACQPLQQPQPSQGGGATPLNPNVLPDWLAACAVKGSFGVSGVNGSFDCPGTPVEPPAPAPAK